MSRQYLLIVATRATAPEVRVLADDLARVDPTVPRTIVVVDEDPQSLELLGGAGEIKAGADLGLDLDLVGRWVGAYGERGLIWAAFPHVLSSIGDPGDHVLWISGDVAVVQAPEPFWAALEESDLVAGLAAPSLAPHDHERRDSGSGRPYALQSASAVKRHAGELVSRSVLGWAVGSRAATGVLSDWPVPRDFPTHESLATALTAQLWFNALALNSEATIVQSPGSLLSAIQLQSHKVEPGSTDTTPLVDGEPLILLGLRGFDARRPYLVEGEIVTTRVSEQPALAPLLRKRAEALIAAGWTWTSEKKIPGTKDKAPRGTRWDKLPEGLPHNWMTQDLIRDGLREGTITQSPFSEDGFDQLRAYALQPARQGASVGVNRMLHAMHGARPDVYGVFPTLDGKDGLAFIEWAWNSGREEMSIPESFLPHRPDFIEAAPEEPLDRWEPDTEGVNLAGYFTSELGLGESARQIAQALEATGVPITPVQGLRVPPTRQEAEFLPVGPEEAHHDVNIVVVNGEQMPDFAHDVGEAFFAGRPTIGVWWWEVDPYPAEEWAPALHWLDELWVGTDFIRDLIEPHVDVPVWVFPVPVSVQRLESPLDRAHFGWKDDETVFLYIWDYHSTEARKNPSGLVEAYRRAFPEGSKTRLVLKCINHENLPEADEKVRLAAVGRDDIVVIDRFLSRREMDGLLELCDCYVSPHRSEGFGYTPAEAMLLGKPVVLTGYGGTTQYADETVARIVKWAPSQVGPGALPYPPDGHWADPDLDDLADALRWIVEQPEAAAAMAERGRRRVAVRHNAVICGTAMRERLDVVRARYATAHCPPPPPPEPDLPVQPLARRIAGRFVHNRLTSALLRVPRRKWRSLMDRNVASRTVALNRQVADLQRHAADLQQHVADLHQHVIALQRRLYITIERLGQEERSREALLARTDKQVVALQERDVAIAQAQAEHIERHSVEPYGAAEAGFHFEQVEGIGRALGGSDLRSSSDKYADFLAVFRGPYERVLELMQPYGALLAGQGPLLDIGCGRGELLEIAEQVGIEARGVDLDEELIGQAKARGRKAEVGDGITMLREAAEHPLGSISAIHVIEHFSVEDLEALFAGALDALRPGGLLLVETVNPHEVSAASTFWVDPTHRAPIFPEVALALALSTGFASAHVFAPDGGGDWEEDRTRSTRYALIARK
jgi:glycosyltransferase involved in cell wall biosynthesis/2-polyprenyl-3-methyl-5-hydroxy-6-metoxy-1,4-benzoquinol methylase